MTTRVGFIGAGNRSVAHMTSLSHLEDVTVAGITDIDPARAAAAVGRTNERLANGAEPLAPAFYTDVQAMMDAELCDCLYLCLPPYVHGHLDHQVIDFNIPVLFEKPVAVEISVAREIAAHVVEKGIINAAGYQKRYSSAVQEAQSRLAGLPIGMAIGIRLSGLPGQPWWRVQAQSGGMLVEQHTHAVDLMRLLVGEVESAYAVGGTFFSQDVPNLDIFDMNACTVRFAGGIPGTIGNSCAAPEGAPIFPPHLVHVVAKGLTVSVNESKATFYTTGDPPQEHLRKEDDNLVMNRTFIHAVRTGKQEGILSDFADAMQTLAVTLACQQSAETGLPVDLREFVSA